MLRIITLLTLAGMLVFNSQIAAEDLEALRKAQTLTPDISHGKHVYRLCATCHGDQGWGKSDGSFPVIAGQFSAVVIKQLIDIRARDRENPAMYMFADPEMVGGAQAIADVAGYIATLPENPNSGQGDGSQVETGEKLYETHCLACHQSKGQGNEAASFPRLSGQHYGYLNRQLIWVRDGLRKNANPVMLEIVKKLDDSQLSAIADYLSRQ